MSAGTLVEELRAEVGRSNLVIIAGTGVSIIASNNQHVDGHHVARWDGLLQHGVDHCLDVEGVISPACANLLRTQIAQAQAEPEAGADHLVQAADMISRRLRRRSPGTYRRWLQRTVGALEPHEPRILHVLAGFPGVLATLNYDTLLEKATGCKTVTWREHARVEDILRSIERDAVLHLHGCYTQPESVVLGLDSYSEVAGDAHTRAVLELLTIDRTMLFVGCGGTVADPNFSRLIEWSKSARSDTTHRHFFLCPETELERARADLASVPWLAPVAYGADYEDLVPFLIDLAKAAVEPQRELSYRPLAPAFNRVAYGDAMKRKYARLKIEELDSTTHDANPLRLTDMFIPQSVREWVHQSRPLESPKEHERRPAATEEMSTWIEQEAPPTECPAACSDTLPHGVLELATDPRWNRLVIVGDPGSGKSSLLQFLLIEWAQKDDHQGPVPLLIELREYARLRRDGKVSGILDYLETAESARWKFDHLQVGAWLRNGQAWLLFDGLDEVFSEGLRQEVSTSIHRLTDEYPAARIVVTSRVHGFPCQRWRDEGFRVLVVDELDDAQIGDFLARWHKRAYDDPARGEAKCDSLARAIHDSPPIRLLAGNPLLLTMMTILNRTQELPRDRAELYEQCTRLLLHNWKLDVVLASDPDLVAAGLDYKDKRNLLLRVARVMQTHEGFLGTNLIDEDSLEAALADGLRGLANVRPQRVARTLVEHLRGRNFMLCFLGGRSYAFVHRTFLEFFCADDLRMRLDYEKSIDVEYLKREVYEPHWADESWQEVLCLLCGMVHPSTVSAIIQFLLEQPDPGQTCRHLFLAARCVSEVRKRAELGAVVGTVLARLQALVHFDLDYYYEPCDREETDKVKEIRTRAVAAIAQMKARDPGTRCWLEYSATSDDDGQVRRACLQELVRGWSDEPATLAALRRSAEVDPEPTVRQLAVQEYARGWKDDPETLPWLKKRAEIDEDGAVRRVALREVVRGWQDAPETLSWLQVRTKRDEDEHTRWAGLIELARRWKGVPDTLPWLKALAQSNVDGAVRCEAVQEVARGWKHDPDTLRWLRALTGANADDVLCQVALQEVVRGWSDDPKTLPSLSALARLDGVRAVRRVAVRELARGWADHPDTLGILTRCAQADQDHHVRRIAVQELARQWRDHPETAAIVNARARRDADGNVRTRVDRAAHPSHAASPSPGALAQSSGHRGVRVYRVPRTRNAVLESRLVDN